MPKQFPNWEYYVSEWDSSVPKGFKNKNIILTLKGMKEITAYYKEKYEITITPFNTNMLQAPQKIIELILEARQKFEHFEQARLGIIFNNIAAGQHGHAMPMVWEKNADKETLIFLDTGQFLGDTSYQDYSCDLVLRDSFNPEDPQEVESAFGISNHAYVVTDNTAFYISKPGNKVYPLFLHVSLFSEPAEHGTVDRQQLASMQKYLYTLGLDKELSPVMTLDAKQILAVEEITGTNLSIKRGRETLRFRDELTRALPTLALASHIGVRQIDLSSCGIDACAMLKDALRIQPSLTAMIQEKQVAQIGNCSLFYMPEELLKTAQIGSYPEKSNANLEKPMHLHHIKDSAGKRTGKSEWVNLGVFRQKYDLPVPVEEGMRNFGSYTLYKGLRYVAIIKERWEKRQQEEISDTEKFDGFKP